MSSVEMMHVQPSQTARVGQVAAAVILAWAVFALVADLEPNGRHLLGLGTLRVVLFATLLAFAIHVSATGNRLARVGLVLTGLMATLNLVGGAGAVMTDGWSYNPFADASTAAAPPWYAYVIGASGILFAVGTVMVGVAARRAGWLAAAVVAGGAAYPLAYVLQAPLGEGLGAVVGHLVWVSPWLALAVGLATGPDAGARNETA